MLITIVSLLAVLALIRLIWYLFARFWAWLGKGKRLRRAVDEQRVGEDVKEALREADRQRSERALGQAREAVKKRRLTGDELVEVMRAQAAERNDFLDHLRLSWYQIVLLFLIGSFLGLVIEQVWMFVTAGLTESRVGLVWGPFSPLYGVGAILLTIICFELRKHHAKWWVIFLVSLVVGGALEQTVGWGMETFMGAVSWDYSNVPGDITKWVAAPFLVMWGLLGLVWAKGIMPELLFRIGEPTTRRQVVFVGLIALYLGADIFMTLACFDRMAEREQGIPPQNAFQQWIDEHYSNQFMANHFQNMVFTGHDSSSTPAISSPSA